MLAHPVYNMHNTGTKYSRIMKQTAFWIQENRRIYTMFKIFSTYICWINIWNANIEVSGAIRLQKVKVFTIAQQCIGKNVVLSKEILCRDFKGIWSESVTNSICAVACDILSTQKFEHEFWQTKQW